MTNILDQQDPRATGDNRSISLGVPRRDTVPTETIGQPLPENVGAPSFPGIDQENNGQVINVPPPEAPTVPEDAAPSPLFVLPPNGGSLNTFEAASTPQPIVDPGLISDTVPEPPVTNPLEAAVFEPNQNVYEQLNSQYKEQFDEGNQAQQDGLNLLESQRQDIPRVYVNPFTDIAQLQSGIRSEFAEFDAANQIRVAEQQRLARPAPTLTNNAQDVLRSLPLLDTTNPVLNQIPGGNRGQIGEAPGIDQRWLSGAFIGEYLNTARALAGRAFSGDSLRVLPSIARGFGGLFSGAGEVAQNLLSTGDYGRAFQQNLDNYNTAANRGLGTELRSRIEQDRSQLGRLGNTALGGFAPQQTGGTETNPTYRIDPVRGYFGEAGAGLPGLALYVTSAVGSAVGALTYTATDAIGAIAGANPQGTGANNFNPFFRANQLVQGVDLGFFNDQTNNSRYLSGLRYGGGGVLRNNQLGDATPYANALAVGVLGTAALAADFFTGGLSDNAAGLAARAARGRAAFIARRGISGLNVLPSSAASQTLSRLARSQSATRASRLARGIPNFDPASAPALPTRPTGTGATFSNSDIFPDFRGTTVTAAERPLLSIEQQLLTGVTPEQRLVLTGSYEQPATSPRVPQAQIPLLSPEQAQRRQRAIVAAQSGTFEASSPGGALMVIPTDLSPTVPRAASPFSNPFFTSADVDTTGFIQSNLPNTFLDDITPITELETWVANAQRRLLPAAQPEIIDATVIPQRNQLTGANPGQRQLQSVEPDEVLEDGRTLEEVLSAQPRQLQAAQPDIIDGEVVQGRLQSVEPDGALEDVRTLGEGVAAQPRQLRGAEPDILDGEVVQGQLPGTDPNQPRLAAADAENTNRIVDNILDSGRPISSRTMALLPGVDIEQPLIAIRGREFVPDGENWVAKVDTPGDDVPLTPAEQRGEFVTPELSATRFSFNELSPLLAKRQGATQIDRFTIELNGERYIRPNRIEWGYVREADYENALAYIDNITQQQTALGARRASVPPVRDMPVATTLSRLASVTDSPLTPVARAVSQAPTVRPALIDEAVVNDVVRVDNEVPGLIIDNEDEINDLVEFIQNNQRTVESLSSRISRSSDPQARRSMFLQRKGVQERLEEARFTLNDMRPPVSGKSESFTAASPILTQEQLRPSMAVADYTKYLDSPEYLTNIGAVSAVDIVPTRRTNVDLSRLAKFLTGSDGAPLMNPSRTSALSSREITKLRDTHGDVFAQFGKPVPKALDNPQLRLEVTPNTDGLPQTTQFVQQQPEIRITQDDRLIDENIRRQGYAPGSQAERDALAKENARLRDEAQQDAAIEQTEALERARLAILADISNTGDVTDEHIEGLMQLSNAFQDTPNAPNSPAVVQAYIKSVAPNSMRVSPANAPLVERFLVLDDEFAQQGQALVELNNGIIDLKLAIQKTESNLDLAPLLKRQEAGDELANAVQYLDPEAPNLTRYQQTAVDNSELVPLTPHVSGNSVDMSDAIPWSDDLFTKSARNEVWFHGTQQTPESILSNEFSPNMGSSSNELGSGMYFTNKRELAEVHSRASRNITSPLSGTSRLGAPTVYQYPNPTVRNSLPAQGRADNDILFVFNRAVGDVFGDDEMFRRALREQQSKNNLVQDQWLNVREAYESTYKTPISELQYQEFQRVVSRGIFDSGYDSIWSGDKWRGKTLVVLDPEHVGGAFWDKAPEGVLSVAPGQGAKNTNSSPIHRAYEELGASGDEVSIQDLRQRSGMSSKKFNTTIKQMEIDGSAVFSASDKPRTGIDTPNGRMDRVRIQLDGRSADVVSIEAKMNRHQADSLLNASNQRVTTAVWEQQSRQDLLNQTLSDYVDEYDRTLSDGFSIAEDRFRAQSAVKAAALREVQDRIGARIQSAPTDATKETSKFLNITKSTSCL